MEPEHLKKRIVATRHQQFRPEGLTRIEDPITGRTVLLNPNRQSRHTELPTGRRSTKKSRSECYYCRGETTSTLFYVDESLRMVGADETGSLDASRAFLMHRDKQRIDTFYDLVKKISGKTMPPKGWLTRTFLNLVPPMTDYPEMSLITAVSPKYHHAHMHELPLRVLAAMVISWQAIERLAQAEKLQIVPFINGGKRPESGQSISCFHSQVYLTKTPPLYKQIARRRARDGCGVCQTLRKRSLLIHSNRRVKVLVHPAPSRNHGLLVAPKQCQSELGRMDPPSLAEGLQVSLQAIALLTGTVPAYNIAVRCGDSVGHLHAEFVPKTETNVPAGFEEASGAVIITEPPLTVSARLKKLLS